MGRLRCCAPDLFLAQLLMTFNGCGGGSSSMQPPPPPPPQPDFSIGFSQNPVTLQQGATSSAINLSVNPLNGFSGSVQITLTGLPAGVVASPPNPFSIAAGASAPILFSAAFSATAGSGFASGTTVTIGGKAATSFTRTSTH